MSCIGCLKRFSIFEVGQKLQLDCDLGWGHGVTKLPLSSINGRFSLDLQMSQNLRTTRLFARKLACGA